MGLFSIKLQEQKFYDNVHEDSVLTINKDTKTIQIKGYSKLFTYEQSEIEERLLDAGGVMPLYTEFGNAVFRQLTKPKTVKSKTGSKRPRDMTW
jgi:homoaconitate hydratase